MDYDAWRFWIDILQTVLTAAIGVYVWLVNRTRVNAARIRNMEDEIDARLDKAEQRLTKVEVDIEHGPSRDDLKRIHERVDDTAREVHEMTGEFRSVKSTLELIHQFLLNGSRS